LYTRLGKAIRESISRAPELPEWQDAAYIDRQGWWGVDCEHADIMKELEQIR